MALSEAEQDKLWHAVFGNGEEGHDELLRSIKGVLFFNKRTGEPGLVQDVRDIKRIVAQTRAIWWFVGAIVVLSQAWQLLRGLGG